MRWRYESSTLRPRFIFPAHSGYDVNGHITALSYLLGSCTQATVNDKYDVSDDVLMMMMLAVPA